MKVLFDTNVLLDVFLEREPFFEASAQAVGFAEKGEIEGWICGTTVTTIFYLLAKQLSSQKANQHVREILKIFNVSNINRVVLEDALESNFKDYEESLLYQSAIHANLEAIITRNQKDFDKSEIPVYSPTIFLEALDTLE
ncbi:type II toxin-antitoxin system VapC family toxin [Fodinibius sp. AD559]|uniref:type II toxin-antitoxin system VapC family toxin n=1 Tax=Fodinibius sp. AD559 TaxID=3424179 RepID=UPI004046EC9E